PKRALPGPAVRPTPRRHRSRHSCRQCTPRRGQDITAVGSRPRFRRGEAMYNRRTFMLGATAAAAALGLAPCGGEGAGTGGPDQYTEPNGQSVGVAMQTQYY